MKYSVQEEIDEIQEGIKEKEAQITLLKDIEKKISVRSIAVFCQLRETPVRYSPIMVTIINEWFPWAEKVVANCNEIIISYKEMEISIPLCRGYAITITFPNLKGPYKDSLYVAEENFVIKAFDKGIWNAKKAILRYQGKPKTLKNMFSIDKKYLSVYFWKHQSAHHLWAKEQRYNSTMFKYCKDIDENLSSIKDLILFAEDTFVINVADGGTRYQYYSKKDGIYKYYKDWVTPRKDV